MNDANNSENKKEIVQGNKTFNWYAFPYPIFVALVYLAIGFVFNVWHPTWLMFLTVPVYYEMVAMLKKSNWYAFPYPVLVLIAYLCIGVFRDVWHPTWLLFLTIPVYYIMVAMNRAKSFRAKVNIFPYPILCTIFYLALGFDYNIWHPTWLMFLTIPMYYMFANSIKSK